MMQASAGLMSITGPPDAEGGSPQKVGVAISDIMAGMYATTAILAALASRNNTGMGQHIDLALYDCQVAWLANQNMNYLIGGKVPERQGTAHPNIVPYQVFATANGHLMLAVGNETQFKACVEALGCPQLATDPDYMTNAARIEHRQALVDILAGRFLTKESEHWLDVMTARGIPVGPINNIGEIFSEPYAEEREFVRHLEHPLAGEVATVANPVRFSKTPVQYQYPPPLLGQHTAEILGKLQRSPGTVLYDCAMYPWLKDAIDRNAVIITASRRLARELQAAYAAEQMTAGALSWVTPSINFWNDWCKQQLEAAADPSALPLAIGDFSSSILWERCIRKHAPESLPALSGVIRQAREAWQRLNDWNVPLAAVAQSARSADEQLFEAAATEYQALLDAASWTDRPSLPRYVAGLLSNKLIGAPPEVVLAGFDREVPAVTDIVAALTAAGCKVQTAPQAAMNTGTRIAACEDHDAEMRTAGAWARGILRDHPHAKVAIVSPLLQSDADRSARLVREGLAPGWQYAGDTYRSAVDVSYGRKLNEFPAVATALSLLRWLHHGLTTREVSLLLRSRCLAGDDVAGRSRLELALRKLPDRAWSVESLLPVLKGRDDSTDSLAWLRGLEAMRALQAEEQGEASPAHWASRIDSLLGAWRWPGTATLSSAEFQLDNRWRDLLNELAGTAIVTPRLGLRDAVQRLATLAAEVVFQPEADGGMVSLMGTLEAAGMEFDHVWISGMHAGLWPPAGNPSPLLSRALQKKFGLPDATPGDTLRFARRVLQRLKNSTPDVVFSWPLSDGESELAASSLLDEVPHEVYEGPGDPGWHAAQFCSKDATAIAAEDPVPPVAADEAVRGGAYTVQRQTIEPFAAFVYGRLGVRPADPIEAGIAPSLRGNIIHNALHTLFAGRPHQADIKSWDAKNVEQRLGSAIDSALAEHLRHADPAQRRLLGLERARLLRLLGDFIAAEADRAEYSVAEVEKSIDYEAHGVRLKLRIDRLDRLADGSLLVIDYKTGSPRNLLDKDGNPLDLQLVVYADALEDVIGGLALINIDSREISYKETGASSVPGEQSPDVWPEQLAAWKEEVQDALREIAAGDVRTNLLMTADEGRPLAILSRLEELKRVN
jgi:probable DNA repair protein